MTNSWQPDSRSPVLDGRVWWCNDLHPHAWFQDQQRCVSYNRVIVVMDDAEFRQAINTTPQYKPVTPGMPDQGQLPGRSQRLIRPNASHNQSTHSPSTREAGTAAARTVATLASAAPRSPSRHISQTQTRTRTAKPNRSAPPSQWASGKAARNGGTVHRFMTLRSRQSCRAQGKSHQINAACSQKGCSTTASRESELACSPSELFQGHSVNRDGSNRVCHVWASACL